MGNSLPIRQVHNQSCHSKQQTSVVWLAFATAANVHKGREKPLGLWAFNRGARTLEGVGLAGLRVEAPFLWAKASRFEMRLDSFSVQLCAATVVFAPPHRHLYFRPKHTARASYTTSLCVHIERAKHAPAFLGSLTLHRASQLPSKLSPMYPDD